MKKILDFFTNRWVIGAIGILIVSLLIWFLGPLLGFGDARPFESVVVRLVVILLIVLIWLAVEVIRLVRANKAAAKISEGIVEDEDLGADRSAEEIATLKERFEEAVQVLRKTGSGRNKRGLYELPWYIIIGPPGSGKTTALRNSGLRFPLAEKFGNEALRGVGGTRNCDWWFTDEAILLDTAGRYTTQDSEASVDRAAWEGFLDLLKRNRKRRPINGVLIAISLSDLMTQNDQDRFGHARAIKQRIQELDAHFGIRLPVYLLLTKCDLVAGFNEFFEDLGAQEREQVWGMTFPLSDAGEGAEAKLFSREFDALLERLDSRVMARMHAERDENRRGVIYGFPRQIASLKATLNEFIGEVFSGSRFDQAPMLRGVYFTSGTQEGTPIDRLMGAMVRAFGIDQYQQAAFIGSGRSYFITSLLKDVVFPESEIAGTNRRVELRRAWLQRAAYVGLVGILVLAVVAWVSSFTANSGLIADAAQAAADADGAIAAVPLNDRDPVAALDALNDLRTLPAGYAERDERGSLLSGFGLYQGRKLGAQAEAAYRRVLISQLLPRVMFRLEEQVDRNDATTDQTYEALKTYLMLGSEQHYIPQAVEAWVVVDWEDFYYGQLDGVRFEQMTEHLRALLEERPVPLPLALDPARIAAARARLARIPLEDRVYVRMKNAGLADGLPSFTIIDAAGPDAQLVFVRDSGRPMSEGLDPLFTRPGYDQVFTRTDSIDIVRELLAEQWVLRDDPADLSAAELPDLFGQVRDLYLDEYARMYEDLVYDVKIAPFNGAAGAARILNILSGPESPLTELIAAVTEQTTFSGPDASSGEGEAEASGDPYEKLRKRLGARVRTPAVFGQAKRYANTVEERFEDLHDLNSTGSGGASPIAYLQGLLRRIADFMMVVERAGGVGNVRPDQVDEFQRTINEASSASERQPNTLVKSLLQDTVAGSNDVVTGGLVQTVNAQWQAGPYDFCRIAIQSRYPVDRNSREEARLEDFGEFFGFGGRLEGFFTTNIAEYVNTMSRPWSLKGGVNAAIPLTPQALRMFEQAAAIKNSFFRGDKNPYVGFELEPIAMDASINKFTLTLDGQTVVYRHGPPRAELLQWPGPGGTGRVQFDMQPATGPAMPPMRGPWAWFRMLDSANLSPVPGRAEQFNVEFSHGGRAARYRLVARSAYNPFMLDDLHSFRCLEQLTR